MRHLSLPEEFLLLAHRESGKVRDRDQTAYGCAAAELGELALRRRLLVRAGKSRAFGFEVYRGNGRIQLLDTSPTGLDWADGVLTALEAGQGLNRWLRRRRRTALSLHRDALAERRLLARQPGGFLSRERHYPDLPARGLLLSQLRDVYEERRPLDEHMLFLSDLVDGAELRGDLHLRLTWRQRRERARGVGAVEALPEELRDTSTVLGAAIPSANDG
ncbi:GPP34 family phosphoprotein [Nonomuraea typhae]|uniref:GPP34 family phosphoprotein n=1 Tax=Nonomuraea typhae TaxID=2603600 RepID=UPI0012F7C2FA|nr:GPP34 family phosphoprotein [Nonomuraea typhae]